MTTPTTGCSVVIAAYDERRLPLLERAVASAIAQGPDVEVVLAIDHDERLLATARDRFAGVRVVLNTRSRGASGTRNAGARAATGEFLAFLDDDAEAEPGWLAALVAPLRADPTIVGVGGWVEPAWAGPRPIWFPMEFGWVVGASYTGMPRRAAEMRNAWSENMAVRAADFWEVGGFREGFGKLGSTSRPEDTELCLRMAAARSGRWWFEPAARIRHHVPADRATLSFFLRRCRAEGAGKAHLAELAGAEEGLSSERSYATRTLPAGVLRGLLALLRGDLGGPVRALAIVAGLAAAAVGFAEESVRRRRAPAPEPARPAPTVPGPARPVAAPGVPALHRPARVVRVDLADPLPELSVAVDAPDDALVVVSLCGRPVGMLLVPVPTSPAALAAAIEQELGDLVRAEADRHGLPPTMLTRLTAAGLPHAACPVRDRRARLVADGPGITVVLCTRNRPEQARRCLESLGALAYDRRQILVVDNAPADDATEQMVRELPFEVDYVREPRPGLSHARNRALAKARHEIVAFIDDDERADPRWLAALAEEFADPAVGVVTGLVLPGELATTAQVRFEQFGGHSKGRGFARIVVDPDHQRVVQSPLYPRPTFGAGANMAFRTSVLEAIGGFDPGLGAGTRTAGGEDTLAFTEAMLAGHTLVYAPAALTWHHHRRDDDDLTAQLSGYSVGLGAYYAALVTRDPRRLLSLGRLALGIARGRAAVPPAPSGSDAPGAPSIGGVRRARDLLHGAAAYTSSYLFSRGSPRGRGSTA